MASIFALADALKGLLPTLDSFERALHVSAGEKSELRNGVELIHKQLLDALAKLGLRPIEAKGELFRGIDSAIGPFELI